MSLPNMPCRQTPNSFFHTGFQNLTDAASASFAPCRPLCASLRDLLGFRRVLRVGRLALRLPITQRGCGSLVPPPVQVQPPFLRAQARLCGRTKNHASSAPSRPPQPAVPDGNVRHLQPPNFGNPVLTATSLSA